jgi:hypothetical protein
MKIKIHQNAGFSAAELEVHDKICACSASSSTWGQKEGHAELIEPKRVKLKTTVAAMKPKAHSLTLFEDSLQSKGRRQKLLTR